MVTIGYSNFSKGGENAISMKDINVNVRPEVVELPNQSSLPRPDVLVVGVGGAGRHMASQMPGTKLAVCQEGDAGAMGPGHVILRRREVAVARTSSPAALHSSDLPWKARLIEAIGRPDIMFIFSGLGGETGSFVSPLIAGLAHHSTLTFVSVCLPFSVEGIGRRAMAKEGLERLRGSADLVAVYANDPLIKLAPNLPLSKAFGVMDQIMLSMPEEICHSLTANALPLLKENFMRQEMRAGIGYGLGFDRERLAVEEALSSPWFPSKDFVPENALLLVTQGETDRDSLQECVNQVCSALPIKRLLFTTHHDPSLGRRVKASLLLSYRF